MIKSARNNQKGFTLIELMVVIAIIAILAIVGITIYNGLQASARDSSRTQDVQAIAKALENHYIPDVAAAGALCTGSAGSVTQPSYCPALPAWFAGSFIPVDPGGRSFCIASSQTAGAVAPAVPTVPAWVSAGVTNCPTGYSKVDGTQPPVNTTAWTVCSLLEGNSGSVSCQSSSQQ